MPVYDKAAAPATPPDAAKRSVGCACQDRPLLVGKREGLWLVRCPDCGVWTWTAFRQSRVPERVHAPVAGGEESDKGRMTWGD